MIITRDKLTAVVFQHPGSIGEARMDYPLRNHPRTISWLLRCTEGDAIYLRIAREDERDPTRIYCAPLQAVEGKPEDGERWVFADDCDYYRLLAVLP